MSSVIMPGFSDARIYLHSNFAPLLSLNVYVMVQFIFRVIDLSQKLHNYPRKAGRKDAPPVSTDSYHGW
jgi:hypothetical protein